MGAGHTHEVLDLNSREKIGLALEAPATEEMSVKHEGEKSFQIVAADLELSADSGKDITDGTAFLAPIMGNLLGTTLTKTGNYLAGLIGAYSILGLKAAVNGVAGVMGIIMDGVTDADAAVLAVLDGDSLQTKCNAMFGVKKNNSIAGSNPNYGMDLAGPAHNGFSILAYLKAALRLDNNVVVMTGTGAPTDGGAGTGLNFAGPGSLFTNITAGNIYIQTGLISSPVWKLITRAA